MRFTSMGFELAAAIIGLTLVGYWVDHHFQTLPVGVLVGAGLGIVGGLYNFIRAAQRMSRDDAARRNRAHQQENRESQ
jgi:F0F1-type ATP synthase assembly protein I